MSIQKNATNLEKLGMLIPQIEELSLSGIYISSACLVGLSTHCPNLRLLNIRAPDDRIIKYLPAQLESLTLSFASAEKCRADNIDSQYENTGNKYAKWRPLDVVKICPNLSSLGIYEDSIQIHLNFRVLLESCSLVHFHHSPKYCEKYVFGTNCTFGQLWNDSCHTQPIALKNMLMNVLFMMPDVLVTMIASYIPRRIKLA
jgi:hypothetical protein